MAKTKTLVISLDLGTDSIKAAFAYMKRGDLSYGKLEALPPENTPFASLAYYDEEVDTWIFGKRKNIRNFKNIVKITDLLSLLSNAKDSDFYYKEKYFPKFYFPHIDTEKSSFEDLIKNNKTFMGNKTPQEVCEMFFSDYFEKYLDPIVEVLKEENGLSFYKIEYTLVFPLSAKDAYKEEIKNLIQKAKPSCKIVKSISSARAVGLYASHEGYIEGNNKTLVFNIGESEISVSKIYVQEGVVTVDGADGHNKPANIAGSKYDELIRNLINAKLQQREMLGGVQAKNTDFLNEGTHRQQFRLMENIKNVKKYLSLPDDEYEDIFRNGVPIGVERDVTVEVVIDRDLFLNGIGDGSIVSGANKGKNAVSLKIAEYVLEELNRYNNKDVDSIILSGGTSQIYGLKELIAKKTKDFKGPKGKSIKVSTFSIQDDDEFVDRFFIKQSEKTTYGASVGAAIYGLGVYAFKTVATLSYGTWMQKENDPRRRFKIWLKKGTEIPEEGGEYFSEFRTGALTWGIKDEIFSSTATTEILVGEPPINGVIDSARRNAIINYDLRVISGAGNAGYIRFLKKDKDGVYKKTQVPPLFVFEQGIIVDSEGRATIQARNSKASNSSSNKDVLVYVEDLDDFAIQATSDNGDRK
ncbi:MAG: hypothetical protein ACOX24_05560 [Christensenellales bacterium]|jgi:hypothetical protein|nr:hypothetical protein [Clostridiales bacterium]